MLALNESENFIEVLSELFNFQLRFFVLLGLRLVIGWNSGKGVVEIGVSDILLRLSMVIVGAVGVEFIEFG